MNRIHITGASGSGTTALGRALAEARGCPHFDSDDYFWQKKFTVTRAPALRRGMLMRDLRSRDAWVSSGSLVSWGDIAVPLFDLVVFLWIPTELRLERLRNRGASDEEFLDWASRYDTAGMEMRSRVSHEAWLAALPCPVLRLEGDLTVQERVDRVNSVRPAS